MELNVSLSHLPATTFKEHNLKNKRQVSTDIVTEENRMEKHPEKDSGLKRK